MSGTKLPGTSFWSSSDKGASTPYLDFNGDLTESLIGTILQAALLALFGYHVFKKESCNF